MVLRSIFQTFFEYFRKCWCYRIICFKTFFFCSVRPLDIASSVLMLLLLPFWSALLKLVFVFVPHQFIEQTSTLWCIQHLLLYFLFSGKQKKNSQELSWIPMGHTKITGRSIKQKWQTNLVKNGDRARTRATRNREKVKW